MLGSGILLLACNEAPPPPAGEPQPAFVGSASCRDCHAMQYDDWQDSDHDLAMQVANDATVLGNFDDATFNNFGSATLFTRHGEQFVVRTGDSTGEEVDLPVAYTFGVDPLQQYLVEAPGGRLQALPFAWDARAPAEGGQRWYHLYEDEAVEPGDRLHWTGDQQNWNYQCAECHSTNLEVNYDVASDTFRTTWSELDVGCEACHGPGAVHVYQARQANFGHHHGFPVDLDDHGRATWHMNLDTGIAARRELRMRPARQPEACGRCHARRGLISGRYAYGRALGETHRVSLLNWPLYFDDGQIREEVYVYGSFLQSRMYAAGVTCSDCHNPHSLELVTGDDPDDVCGQCHLPATFETVVHHHHAGGDVGCVDCHMTSRNFMGVDARRDHSFRVPRPDLTVTTDSPNACNVCHATAGAQWAVARSVEWWGDIAARRAHFANAMHDARTGFANPELLAVIGNADTPGIARATALTMLSGPAGHRETAAIDRALQDGDPLVRRAALRAASQLSSELLLRVATPLLDDPIRSVRIAAAVSFSPYWHRLHASVQPAFNRAANDFRAAQRATASQPEAHTGLADFEASLGNFEIAVEHYEQALRMQPCLALARVNFADALRRFGDDGRAEAILRDGIGHCTDTAALHHSLGLLLARSGRADALAELREAARLQPQNSRYIYVVAIALNSAGEAVAAVAMLESAMRRFPGDFDIAWALATIYRDRGKFQDARDIAELLADRHPDDVNVSALLKSLESK